jgi:hypothetical protein
LSFFSFATIPLFIVVSLFISDQSGRQHWIVVIGAGMMAWSAASLILEYPLFAMVEIEMPMWVIQWGITLAILANGFMLRKLLT